MSDPQRIHLHPDPALPPRPALLLAQLEDVRRDLKELAGRWKTDQLSREVVPGFFTPGALLLHVAGVEHWWVRVLLAGDGLGGPPPRLPDGALAPFATGKDGDPVPGGEELDAYLDLLDRVRAYTRDYLAGLDETALGRDFTCRDRDGKDYAFGLEWVLHHLVEHEAHHRGQLALMRRLCDTGGKT